jgi:hypothetical protein
VNSVQGRQSQRSQIRKKQVNVNNVTVLYECNHGETKSFLHILLFDSFYFIFLIQY